MMNNNNNFIPNMINNNNFLMPNMIINNNINNNFMQNLNMDNNNSNFQGMNMMRGVNMPNIGDEVSMKRLRMDVDEVNNGPKKTICFKNTQGYSHNIVVNYETTIEQLINKYLNVIERPDLIEYKSNKIIYFYTTHINLDLKIRLL